MEPEGAPTETQALQAFFNGAEEENDSVCGTEVRKYYLLDDCAYLFCST